MGAALEIDLLRTFVAAAETLSFTRAAARVGRTQAAVSQQIQRLEALTGCALFVRGRGGPPILTAKGAYLLDRAHELLALNDEISTSLKNQTSHETAGRARRAPRSSVCVLPFRNMSGDAAQDYLAQGLGAAVLGALSRMRWLRVVAGEACADKADFRYSLAGGVFRAGARVRLVVRLLETESGAHLWAETIDAGLDDLFVLQDRIADRVAGLIEPELMISEIAVARRKPPGSFSAYDHFLQGYALVAEHTASKAQAAIPLLEKALALEPGYSAAEALLAWAHEICFTRAGFNETHRRAAITHGRAAIATEADDPTALSIGGFVLAFLAVDRDAALASIERAISINPASATVAYLGAQANAICCRPGAAGAYATRALELCPRHPLAFEAHLGLAIRAELEGRWGDAAACGARAVHIKPGFGSAHLLHAIAMALDGRVEEAGPVVRRGLELEPNFRTRMFDEFDCPPELLDPTREGCRRLRLPG